MTLLSKLDPRTLFYTTVLYVIALVFMDKYFDVIFILPFITLQAYLFSLDFSWLKKLFRFSIMLFISIILINYFLMNRDINYIAVSVFRVMGIIFLAAALVSSLNIRDLGFVMESLFSPLKLFKLPVESIGIITSLAFKFIPLLKEETDRIMLAQKARGIDFDLMTFKERLKNIPSLCFPVIISGVQNALSLAIAMEVRGFGNGIKRTRLKTHSFAKTDYYYLAFSLSVTLVWIYIKQ